MKNSSRQSLVKLTRQDIQRVCEKYRGDKPKLRQILLEVFRRSENIHLFGWFINRRYIRLDTPDFHKDILSLASNKELKYIGIAAPRGHAKSTTVDFVFALWSTVYKEHHFGVIISDTVTQSVEFVNALKDEFENNVILHWLYGDLTSNDWRDGEFVTSTGVKWVAKGAGMKVRGLRHREWRPDLIILDDLENDERVATVAQRQKLKKWLVRAVLPALSRDGRAILIGTVLHHDSLLQNILKHRDSFASWTTRLFQAISSDKNGKEQALWPEHMDLDYLRAIRDDSKHPKYIGSIAFAQEYQNKPFDEADAIIKPDQIQWTDKIPSDSQIVATVLTVDPAVSERAMADPTGKVIASLGTDGNIYVRYVGNERLSPKNNSEDIKRLDEIYKPRIIGIENGALGLVFRELLAGLPVIGLEPDKDKVRRLLAVSRFFEAGKIYFVQGSKNINELYDQLLEFPKGSHDDMVDALVYAIRLLLVDGVDNESASDFDNAGTYYEENDNENW